MKIADDRERINYILGVLDNAQGVLAQLMKYPGAVVSDIEMAKNLIKELVERLEEEDL